MNDVDIRKMAGTLSAQEKYELAMNKVSGMKSSIHGQVKREDFLEAGLIVSELSLSSVPYCMGTLKDAQVLFSEDCALFPRFNQCVNCILAY